MMASDPHALATALRLDRQFQKVFSAACHRVCVYLDSSVLLGRGALGEQQQYMKLKTVLEALMSTKE